jgi:hypothetical protein
MDEAGGGEGEGLRTRIKPNKQESTARYIHHVALCIRKMRN